MTRMTPDRTRTLSLALLAVPLAACVGTAPTPSVERSAARAVRTVEFAENEIETLQVHAHRGHVVILPGVTPSCRVDAEVVALDAGSADRLASELSLSLTRPDASTAIVGFDPAEGLRIDDVNARWEVRVPASVRVRVVAFDADVSVRGVASDIEVATASGDVDAHMAGGAVACTTVSGSILVDGEFEAVRAESELGRVTVELPQAHLLDDTAIALRSERGELRLRAGRDQRFELRFATEEGVVLSELPVTWDRADASTSEVRYRGLIGAGDAPPSAEVLVESRTADLRVQRVARVASVAAP